MDDLPLYNLFLIFLLLFLSSFFCVSEGSLFSLGRHQRERLKKESKKSSALIERLLQDPYKLIITILFADEVVNVAYSSVVGLTVASVIGDNFSENSITLLSIAIASPTLLLFGEIGPKVLGVKYPRVLATFVSYPLHLFHLAITPIRWVIMIFSISFTWLLGGKIEYEHKKDFSPDEVKTLLGMGSEEGVVTETEKKLVDSLFNLEEVPAYKIMTPAIDCFFLPSELSASDAVREVKKRGFSRIPVYKGERDNVVGVLYAKDLLSPDISEDKTVDKVVRPPYFIPRTKMAFDLLREFQQQRIHISVVVDEYGRVDGIVTLEDILEELFGEIEDERRVVGKPVVRWESKALVIPGSMKIDEFNDGFLFTVLRFGGLDSLGSELEESILPVEEEHETLGGFVFDLFGSFPSEGESVSYGSLLFSVEKITGKRIAEIRVERQESEVAADVA